MEMLKIFYTINENVEDNKVLDESLINSVESEVDPDGVFVISRWNLDEYNNMKVREYKEFLNNTDYKMTYDYYKSLSEDEQIVLTNKRADARAFIRNIESQQI
jgi:hypothetical protein